MDYFQVGLHVCGLKSFIGMKTRLFDNFLPKTKHYLFLRDLEAIRGFEATDLEAETLHSCRKIDHVK